MDYHSIRIPPERITGGQAMNAAYKLKKLLFALNLYPDWKLASTFSGIADYRRFLDYWLGKELAFEIVNDVRNRRMEFCEDNEICTVLEHAFNKYASGQDYLNPFLEDYEFFEEPIDDEPLVTQEKMMEMLQIDWSYETIVKRVDDLVELERVRGSSVMVDSGKYWIVAYRQLPLKTILKPFVLLARVSESDNSVLGIQGLWPVKFMKTRIDRLVPLPYTAALNDIRYIQIEVVPTEKGPHMYKYKSIKSWDTE